MPKLPRMAPDEFKSQKAASLTRLLTLPVRGGEETIARAVMRSQEVARYQRREGLERCSEGATALYAVLELTKKPIIVNPSEVCYPQMVYYAEELAARKPMGFKAEWLIAEDFKGGSAPLRMSVVILNLGD